MPDLESGGESRVSLNLTTGTNGVTTESGLSPGSSATVRATRTTPTTYIDVVLQQVCCKI